MIMAMLMTLLAFFVCAMVAHGELYASRPPASQLTEFYFWMSAGGVLGGIFCALIAPLIFSTILEYPVLLVLALCARPDMAAKPLRSWLYPALAITALAAMLAMPAWLWAAQLDPSLATARYGLLVLAMIAIMLAGEAPGRLVGLTAATLILGISYPAGLGHAVSHRSFFGVHRIMDSADGRVRLLYHGTTIHGAQFTSPAANAAPPEMLTYYYEGGPMSQAIHAARETRSVLADVAVVGLGAGSLACAAKPDEKWRFFEIDPVVAAIAADPKNFRFLSECGKPEVVLGDARLTLASDTHQYDLIVLDAFSSDAIPVHLLTTQAMALYQSRLKPGGTVVLHISNRHTRLDGVVQRVAEQAGLVAWLGQDNNQSDFLVDFRARAAIAVVASSNAEIGSLQKRDNWVQLGRDPSIVPWSDDYANILQAIWRHLRG